MRAAYSVPIAVALLATSAGVSVAQSPRIRVRDAADGVSAPVLLKEYRPRYPATALYRNVEGTVTLHAVVQPDGRVGKVTVVRPLDVTVEYEAVRAVELWQFKPALRAGEPVEAVIEIDLAFSPVVQVPVYRPRYDVTLPRLVHEVKPSYTSNAMREKVSGVVGLDLVVLPDGTLTDIRVTRPLHPDLDESAVAALKQWRFRPGLKDGQPVPVVVDVEMAFTLKEAP